MATAVLPTSQRELARTKEACNKTLRVTHSVTVVSVSRPNETSHLVVVDGLDELVLEPVDGERLPLLQDGHVGLPPERAPRARDDVLLPLGHVRARRAHPAAHRAALSACNLAHWFKAASINVESFKYMFLSL